MNDLVQFLRDRLDEDEEVARAATQGDWVWSREFVTPPGYHHRTIGPLEPGDAAFIARQHPARVLAEVDAKRQILRALESAEVALRNTEPGKEPRELMTGATNSLRAAVRLLAAAHADRPGYREDWRP